MTCDRVQIINQGRLVYSDEINNLNQRMQCDSLLLGLSQPPAESELAALPGIARVETLSEHRFRLHYTDQANPAAEIARYVVEKNWGLQELTPEQKTLEQVFVELTSGDTHDETAGEDAA